MSTGAASGIALSWLTIKWLNGRGCKSIRLGYIPRGVSSIARCKFSGGFPYRFRNVNWHQRDTNEGGSTLRPPSSRYSISRKKICWDTYIRSTREVWLRDTPPPPSVSLKIRFHRGRDTNFVEYDFNDTETIGTAYDSTRPGLLRIAANTHGDSSPGRDRGALAIPLPREVTNVPRWTIFTPSIYQLAHATFLISSQLCDQRPVLLSPDYPALLFAASAKVLRASSFHLGNYRAISSRNLSLPESILKKLRAENGSVREKSV